MYGANNSLDHTHSNTASAAFTNTMSAAIQNQSIKTQSTDNFGAVLQILNSLAINYKLTLTCIFAVSKTQGQSMPAAVTILISKTVNKNKTIVKNK